MADILEIQHVISLAELKKLTTERIKSTKGVTRIVMRRPKNSPKHHTVAVLVPWEEFLAASAALRQIQRVVNELG